MYGGEQKWGNVLAGLGDRSFTIFMENQGKVGYKVKQAHTGRAPCMSGKWKIESYITP